MQQNNTIIAKVIKKEKFKTNVVINKHNKPKQPSHQQSKTKSK
jgi:hypothetical protein